MGTPYTAEDWITRDDMAVLMRRSADTVRRVHEKHELETRTDDAGRVLVNVGDYLRLGKIRPEDLTTCARRVNPGAAASPSSTTR